MAEVMDGMMQGEMAIQVVDPKHLNRAVKEVFGLMLGVPVSLAGDVFVPAPETEVLTGMVGLAGAISGTCAVVVKSDAAIHMAACMAGIELDSVDDTVLDGLGEICNMLAGAWKAKIPELNAVCMLSVPTVVTGSRYVVHRKAPAFLVEQSYEMNGYMFAVRVYGVIQ